MMKRIGGIMVLITAGFCLLGCSSWTEVDWIRHPRELKQQMQHCPAREPSSTEGQTCKVVMQAAQDLTAMIAKIEQDPEGFGDQLLRLQMQYRGEPDIHQQIEVMLAVLGLNSPE